MLLTDEPHNPALHTVYDSTTIIVLHVSARSLRQNKNNALIHINKQHGKYIQQFSVQKTFTKKQQGKKKILQQNATAEQCVPKLTLPACSVFHSCSGGIPSV